MPARASERAMTRSATVVLVLALLLAGCGSGRHGGPARRPPAGGAAAGAARPGDAVAREAPLPGMPPPLDPHDVYAADRAGRLSPVVRGFRPLVYVPNSDSASVDVIDPRTYRVVAHFRVGRLPQHVTPSFDLRTLWVDSDEGNSLTPVDPRTGRPRRGGAVPVADPYNLYFTPDGRDAVVVAERLGRLDFRDPRTMKLRGSLPVPCNGVDHIDLSATGRYAVVSCEFSGELLKVDVARRRLAGAVFVPTGRGAHGLYARRDSRSLYVSNRGEGSVSVLSFASRRVVATWHLPGGGSPDMGGVSADERVLWLSGRYNAQVYAIDTRTGRLLARIRVGAGPHGLCVYPQPGRYSLGHTGVFR